VTRGPDFDDLVGTDVPSDERERLRETHELLLAAGPPPELPPHLEAGPTLTMTFGRRRTERTRRRVPLLAAAAIAVLLVFLAGYAVGNHKGTNQSATPVRTLALEGTAAAPAALASLRLLPVQSGNWPMTLTVTDLPRLPQGAFYEVYLFRSGRPWASCGTFVVHTPSGATTVTLNAPYRLQKGDTWIVTRQAGWDSSVGPTVLRPVT